MRTPDGGSVTNALVRSHAGGTGASSKEVPMKRSRTSMIAGVLALALALWAVPAALASRHATQGAAADCVRGQLGVRANGTNGAAGTIYGTWVFTNLSTTTCRLDGYPDLQLYGRSGRPHPHVVRKNLAPGPTQVSLAPGASATFRSSYSDVSSTPSALSGVGRHAGHGAERHRVAVHPGAARTVSRDRERLGGVRGRGLALRRRAGQGYPTRGGYASPGPVPGACRSRPTWNASRSGRTGGRPGTRR